MKTINHFAGLLFGVALLTGCMSENAGETPSVSGSQGSVTSSDGTAVSTTENKASASYGYDEMYAPKSDDTLSNHTFDYTCNIVYSSNGATVSDLPDSVTLTSNSNGNVVLTGTTSKNVNYKVTGSGTGSLKIYSDHLYKVELAGVTLTAADGPAINLQSKKRAFIIADAGTVNALTDAAEYATSTEDQKATLFSEGQMVFGGTGTINVTGNAKHGVCSDQYIVMNDAVVNILSASSDGIHTDEAFLMQSGTLKVASTGDGVQSESGNIAINGGTVNITTTGETAHGFTCERYFRATDGDVTVAVSGKGAKDIKSDANVVFTGGDFTLADSGTSLYESNDLTNPACVKADSCVYLTGATLTCKSTGKGGKGINADNDLKIDGGTVTVTTTGGEYQYSNSLSSSAKGICSEANIMFNGGTITVSTLTADGDEGVESKNTFIMNGGELVVNAYDDAINAASAIYFEGGKTYAYAKKNDAIDSNGSLTIGGGVILALSAAGSPEEGIDTDNANLNISGGTVITMGGAQGNAPSVPTSSTATQCTALLSNISLTKGNYLSLNASDGTNVLTFNVPFSVSSDYTLITSPNFVQGGTYTATTGSTAPTDATETWNGLYLGSSCIGSSSLSSFTFSSTYSGTSSSTGGSQGGGMR